MTIVASWNYEKKLYQPLRSSSLNKNHNFILPHEFQINPIHSRDLIINADLILAEVSHPSTGLGIELGWANAAGRQILCLHQHQTTASLAIKTICSEFISYQDSSDLIEQLITWVREKSGHA